MLARSVGQGLRDDGAATLNLKYPRTPYWPYSPHVGRKEALHPDPGHFTGVPVVVTEKLDGSNVLLHRGKVHGRSVTTTSDAKWMALVKKHHAWKVTEPDVYLYGEDIYGVHSIAYDAVKEDRTFYAFALRDQTGTFASFAGVEAYAERHAIPVVPVLFKGTFDFVEELCAFVDQAHAGASALGGEREGVVVRRAAGFAESGFALNVCKSVRAGHVQSGTHWTHDWRPCRIAGNCRT